MELSELIQLTFISPLDLIGLFGLSYKLNCSLKNILIL